MLLWVLWWPLFRLGEAIDAHTRDELKTWRRLPNAQKRLKRTLTPFVEKFGFQTATAGLVIFGSVLRMLRYGGELFGNGISWGSGSLRYEALFTASNASWFTAAMLICVPFAGFEHNSTGASLMRGSTWVFAIVSFSAVLIRLVVVDGAFFDAATAIQFALSMLLIISLNIGGALLALNYYFRKRKIAADNQRVRKHVSAVEKFAVLATSGSGLYIVTAAICK